MKENLVSAQKISERYIQVYYTLYSARQVRNKREFCIKTDLCPQNFSSIEEGTRYASITQLCAMITNLNINPVWLMTGEGKMFANG